MEEHTFSYEEFTPFVEQFVQEGDGYIRSWGRFSRWFAERFPGYIVDVHYPRGSPAALFKVTGESIVQFKLAHWRH